MILVQNIHRLQEKFEADLALSRLFRLQVFVAGQVQYFHRLRITGEVDRRALIAAHAIDKFLMGTTTLPR